MPSRPNLPGGPNPVPTSRGGWGHEKPFKNNGVPNLTPWSQPFATHSCGRTEKVGNMFFYTKREGPPLGTPRLGPHSVKPLGRNDKELSQPRRRLGPHGRRLGPGRAARRSSPAALSLVVNFSCNIKLSALSKMLLPTALYLYQKSTAINSFCFNIKNDCTFPGTASFILFILKLC